MFSDHFHLFFKQIISLFEELIVDRLLWNTGPLYVLHYEDLKKDTFTHLRHLLNFIEINQQPSMGESLTTATVKVAKSWTFRCRVNITGYDLD
ncbi:hypothetical protein Pmani_001114 [Petrolisthes manimaculis]|uniref:Sulfotransferase n=1 Tax=Petrolisthes manimaculis TaxID=1843537 RepID=A0AAE1QL56_9EUCA|nr:hypothetical protein Pmani_001114 [Petrolisthes manimaculis]